MTGAWNLGNDVVDLRHPGGTGRGTDQRFLRRVCTPAEAAAIGSAPDADSALWVHWAGKEAIFKSSSKALGSPPAFQHRLFEVGFDEGDLRRFLREAERAAPSEPLAGIGRYGDLHFRIRVDRRKGAVHAISWIRSRDGSVPPMIFEFAEAGGSTRGPADGLQDRFSDREWGCVTHRASGLTRILARKVLAGRLGVEEGAVEIRCGPGLPGRRIPSVWSGGRELPVDLTLSHHGSFLAFAFLELPFPGSISQ